MLKIGCLKEKDEIISMPQEVQDTILGILEVLDSEYGADRNYEDDGGSSFILFTIKI